MVFTIFVSMVFSFSGYPVLAGSDNLPATENAQQVALDESDNSEQLTDDDKTEDKKDQNEQDTSDDQIELTNQKSSEDQNLKEKKNRKIKQTANKPDNIKEPNDEQPALSLTVGGSDGVWATSTTPARSVTRAQIYGGWQQATYYMKLEYTGLKPNTQYNIKRFFKGPISSFTSTGGSFTTNDTGNGTWTSGSSDNTIFLYFWSSDYTGTWNISVELTNAGDSNEKYTAEAPSGDKSASIDIRGIASMELDGESLKSSGGSIYLLKNENTDPDEEKSITAKATLKGLEPNKEYTITSSISEVTGGEYSYPKNIGSQNTQTMSSDADGTVSFAVPHTLKMGEFSIGLYYTHRFSVRQTDADKTDNTVYSFYPSQLVSDIVPDKSKLYIFKDDVPEDEPSLVEVEIVNKIEGTDTILKGSKLSLIKGSSIDEGEIIASWTQGDSPEKISLEPGEYILVQESVPGEYELAQPMSITLTEEDVQLNGYLFESGYRYDTDENGSVSMPMIIRRNESKEPGDVVFCVNMTLPFGQRIDPDYNTLLYYKEYNLTDAVLNDVITNPRLPADQLKLKLLQIVYAGYPDDKSGLKKKYDLSASQLQNVTQCAIHYYTDSAEYQIGEMERIRTEKEYNAFQELIHTDIKVPDGMSVKIYVAYDSKESTDDPEYTPARERFQSLVSTHFDKESKTVSLELFNKKTEEPDEPDVPDTPDKPDVPDTPDKPDVPDTPDKPDVPDTPDKPDVPDTPDKPDVPDTPDKPDVPDKKEQQPPNLSVKKTSSVKNAYPGDIIPYTITIDNTGNGTAHSIKVTDIMGENLEYVSDKNNGDHHGKLIDWVIDVPANSSISLSLKCRVKENAAGKIINNVVIFDPQNPDQQKEYNDKAVTPLLPPPPSSEGEKKKKETSKSTKKKAVKRTVIKKTVNRSTPANTSADTSTDTSDSFPLWPWIWCTIISAACVCISLLRKRI